MKPDKFDIKIQEAAAQNEAAYDEQAWSAMEKLLDEKMPQKKKRKKRFLWLFLFIFIFILTGGAFLMIWPSKDSLNTTASVKTNTAKTSTQAKEDHVLINKENITTENVNNDPASAIKEPAHNKPQFLETKMNSGIQRVAGKKAKDNNGEIFSLRAKESENEKNTDPQKPAVRENKEPLDNDNEPINTKPTGKDVVKENKIVTDTNDSSIAKSNTHDSSFKKISAQNPEKKFTNSFSLHFSLGAEVSALSLQNMGKVQPVYGVGIGYMINKRFTIRTGFYVARKVYDAKKTEYDPPAGFWNYYPDLKSIDADCKIYEVPLLINYNFRQLHNHQWFISAGLSSYFMKKEDYEYFSKNPSGQSWYNNYQIRNKNQHYFSSLRLAAGYEKNVGKNISIIAEPYVSLPFSGVGYGKVKLYSAGVLFSVSINPFSKK